MPNAWIDTLRIFICQIYLEWGGDCNSLPFPVSEQISTLWSNYRAHGAPGFPNQQEKDEYLKTLIDTETHLKLPGNDLSAGDNTSIALLIDSLQADLGEVGK